MRLPNWLNKLSVRRVALVDQPANPAAEVVLFKAKNPPAPPPVSDDGTCPSCKVPLGDGGKCPECGYMAKAPEGNTGPPAKLPKSPPGSDEHDAYKGVTKMPDEKKEVTKEAVVELLEKAEVTELRKALEHEKAEKKLLAERVEKIELARRNEVYVAKATEFDYLAIKPDDFGPILSKVDAALTDADRQTLWSMLRSANQAIKHSALFGERGVEGLEGLGTSEPEQALQKIAKSYQEADPKLDFAAAYTKACRDNKSLYEKYEADRRSARR